MRWRIPLVVVLALFVAVSCDQQLVEPEETADINLAVKTVDDDDRVPVAFSEIHACTGELVFFEGTDRVMFKAWDNGHFKFHAQYNLTGVDGNGLKYRYTDAFNEEGTGDFPYVFTSTGKVVSATGEDNFIWTRHVTINANGDVTSDIANPRCVG